MAKRIQMKHLEEKLKKKQILNLAFTKMYINYVKHTHTKEFDSSNRLKSELFLEQIF